MLTGQRILYDVADRTRAIGVGGLGAIHNLAQRVGLIKAIDRNVNVLRKHLPYHESDHVLNIAYNLLAGGDRLEDIELLRNDEAYLDALGAQRIPDPTYAFSDSVRELQNRAPRPFMRGPFLASSELPFLTGLLIV